MADQQLKDQIISSLRESKRLEKREKLLEALTVLDKVSSHHDSKLIEHNLSLRLTNQIALLCNRLVTVVAAKVPYLRRAEQTLLAWIQMANGQKLQFNEKVFRILLLTFNNWATYYQSTQNYHMTLSYLLRGLKLIDEHEIKDPDSFNYVAKTQLNVSALYSELRRYEDAVLNAESCLATLQKEMKLRFSKKLLKNMEGKEKAKAENMFVTYVIAFFNIGVAEEYLNNKEKMYKAFKNAVEIGSQFLNKANPFVISAQNALRDVELAKRKSLTSPTSRNSIRISPDELVLKIKEHTKNKFSLTVHQTEKKTSRSEATLKKAGEKRPGRYYTEAKLKKVQERLEQKKKMNFVSVDQYFYQEISKLMNVQSDIKFLRPLTTSGAKNLWDQQDEEKLKITSLREKKRQPQLTDTSSPPKLSEKIQKLKQLDECELKKQEIKIKSKMKTKVFKHLLRAINDKDAKYNFPQQSNFQLGLSFKPPLNHLRRCSSEYIEKNSSLKQNETRTFNLQGMKDEIENMMERITTDIRNIDVEKGVVRARSPDVFFTSQKSRDDNLAKSALKRTVKKKPKTIISAIEESFRPKISPKVQNPKILLRANTLINYQV